MEVFGYRVGPVGYVTDAKAVPDAAIERLRGVRVLVLNALFDRPHPTHLSIPEAIEVARAVGAERTLLTHLTHRHLHTALAARLPAGIEPAYDGLTVTF
jgi:phosphoribosyl 1,2-cyclic phosphate phosphodiesterase